jgi:hypothetical protein
MSPFLIAIGSWIILILLLEGIMWKLFKYKFCQICVESDATIFHFFTMGRMRLIILLHMLSLIAIVIVSHFLLWP